ncbi:trigger factor [Hominifimenecus sp. rT4P-3]|uniref:trigger factor n=1 Tax=Hominifimenecus sp. rT4P-3 TaxID=3242979 RepID=UPI003DA399F2
MSVKVENLEKNLAKLTVEVPVEKLEAAIEQVYRKARNQITLPGFRKGKAPRKMIEKYYGADVFLEDAVNELVPAAYEDACKESGLEIVSHPEIAYEQIEPAKPVIFTATVATRPEVTLGEYKGLEVEEKAVEVTEEEVLAELTKEQEKNATMKTVDDRAVEDGDIIELAFEGFVDGVPFEGGKSENYPLTIGSHSFIPGFEEQLIGAVIGEEKDVNVTFPEEYHAKELAGKPAVFKCTVHSIKVKELPALDDEFASEVSDFESLDEYKEDVKKKLTENKEKEAKIAKEDALVDKIIENSQMEIPELMVTSQARNMVGEFGQRLQAQGLNLQQYMQYSGQTEEQMVEQMKDQAKKRIQTRLVLEAIVAAENLSASEEDVEEEIKKMADAYGMDVDQVKTYMDDEQKEQMKENIAVQKAIDLVYGAAK